MELERYPGWLVDPSPAAATSPISHRDAEVPEAEIGKNRFDRIQVDFVHEHVDVGGHAYLGRVVDELAKRGTLQQDRPQTPLAYTREQNAREVVVGEAQSQPPASARCQPVSSRS